MAVKVRAEGFENLYAKIKEMGNKAEAVIDTALDKAIEPIYQEVKRLAPYDSSGHKRKYGEGHLKDEIPKNKVTKSGTEHSISVGWEKSDDSKHYYAKFLEWGRSDTSRYRKQPFMQPGYQRKKNKSFEVFEEEMKKGLGL